MSSVIDQIKERIDIVELISAHVQLRKSGRNFVGFCPFHLNSKSPAFYVFPETQSYHCFGCKASGTVFDFLMQREGLEFRAALEQLAHRAGIQLRERTEQDEHQDQLRTRLLDINSAAAAFFHHMLVKSSRGEAARAYVAERRIDSATTETFQLGYSTGEWSALLTYLTDRKGFELEEIEAAGLIIKHETRGYYDRFRDRLMFPIRNQKGEVIAFGGRSLGDGQPKYMNSPQTTLFDKSRVLYGLDLARDAIRAGDAAVIVEGYVDVIIAHQHGFRNVVAPLGTALTAQHVGGLKKLAHTVYLALDADAAGVRATLKGAEVLQDNLAGHAVPVPTPQGFIRWERELDAVIKVIALPDGKDPDEVIWGNPDQWRALVAGARPVMDFYITALTADLDLRDAKGKAEAVARLAPLLAQIANPIERAHYVGQIAEMVQIREQVLVQAIKPSARSAPQIIAASPEPPSREDYLLSWLLRYPTARTAVQEKLQQDLEAAPLLREMVEGSVLELLEQVDNRAIWQAWLAQPQSRDPQIWISKLDEALQAQCLRLLALDASDVPERDALECATILQKRCATLWKEGITRQLTETTDDDVRHSIMQRWSQINAYINRLSQAETKAG